MIRHIEIYSRAPWMSAGIIGAILAILAGCYVYQRYAIGKSQAALEEFQKWVGDH